MNLEKFKRIALKNKSFKDEYEKYDLAFEIGQKIIENRLLKGITQSQLAKLVGTKQPSIARLESGEKLPSLRFLAKIAEALETDLMSFFNNKSYASQAILSVDTYQYAQVDWINMTNTSSTPAQHVSFENKPIPSYK